MGIVDHGRDEDGVGDACRTDDFVKLVNVTDTADVGHAVFVFLPVQIAVANGDARRFPVVSLVEVDDAPKGGTEADAISVLVGKIKHQGNLGVVEFQVIGVWIGAVVRDTVAFVRPFLVE